MECSITRKRRRKIKEGVRRDRVATVLADGHTYSPSKTAGISSPGMTSGTAQKGLAANLSRFLIREGKKKRRRRGLM